MTATPDELHIAPMTAADLPRVHQLETLCFADPWDIDAYHSELANPTAVYYTARLAGQVVGFAGMWAVGDEAHIVTLAVDPDYRRRGIARALLNALLARARLRVITSITLEVRVSNTAAQALYRSLGFTIVAHRRRYYPDNGEDAAIMRLRFAPKF